MLRLKVKLKIKKSCCAESLSIAKFFNISTNRTTPVINTKNTLKTIFIFFFLLFGGRFANL